MLAEKRDVRTLTDQILSLLQVEVARLARCTPEEVGIGNVAEVGLDSRPMLVVVARVERKLECDRILKREDITTDTLTNLWT